MGLFSKKEKVPEIPSAPQLPKLPSPPVPELTAKEKLPELPSFPSDSKHENINREIVKSVVSDNQIPEDNEVVVDMPSAMLASPKDGLQSSNGIHNIESAIPSPPQSLKPEEKRRTLELSPSISFKPMTKQVEPIFVSIDKFQEAQKDFKQIKLKVKEIESVLKKVRTIKEKEEAEISGWIEDLEKLKSRLAEVDANIFNQL